MGNWQSSLRWIFDIVTTIIKSSLRYTRSLFDSLCESAQDIQLRIESFLRWVFNIVVTIIKSALRGTGSLFNKFCDLIKYLHRRISTPQGPYSILQISLDKLPNATISLNNRATACRFRLVDCNAFLDLRILSVIEFPKFPPSNITYASISYPWRDLQMPDGLMPPEGSFGVCGAEHADKISIDVLRTACVAARSNGAPLLWLDRLCLIQTSKEDKNWQIQRMYQIYQNCKQCLVFPGGLVRLARLSESTTWLDRAWTLQEAVANGMRDTVKCVFSFTHSTFPEFVQKLLDDRSFSREFIDSISHNPILQHCILEPGHSGICDLFKLISTLSATMMGFEMRETILAQSPDNFPLRIVSIPTAKLLKHSLLGKQSMQHQFLWISAFSRTSSRPVDMVFSIMGPMGVDLPVARFDANDRLNATIKLIQALMQRGRYAEWLFIAPELRPSPELSTLPAFPETSESGKAMIKTSTGRVLASEAVGLREPWRTEGAPYGVMSDQGYFTFRARAASIVGRGENTTSSKNNAYLQCATANAGIVKGAWAVVVGRHKELNRNPETGKITLSPSGMQFPETVEITLMFIERHSSEEGRDLYHRVGMEHEIDEIKTIKWAWTEREFSVGGPGRGDRVRFAIAPEGPVYC